MPNGTDSGPVSDQPPPTTVSLPSATWAKSARSIVTFTRASLAYAPRQPPRRGRSQLEPPCDAAGAARHDRPRTVADSERSARLWKAQIDAARGGVGPTARDDLASRIEVDRLGAVRVRVSEERRLPAAERVVGDGNRD